MRYRKLGNSELSVSEISLGTWGVCEGVSAENMKRALFVAIDLGINLIDTSNSYASGEAETFLGRTLKDIQRSSCCLRPRCSFPSLLGKVACQRSK